MSINPEIPEHERKIMNVATLKKVALLVAVIVVACLLASFIFKVVQFLIVAAVIAVIAAILYAVLAPKVLNRKNRTP